MKKACFALFVNKVVGLEMHFIGLLSCRFLITSKNMYWLSKVSINIDNPNSEIPINLSCMVSVLKIKTGMHGSYFQVVHSVTSSQTSVRHLLPSRILCY